GGGSGSRGLGASPAARGGVPPARTGGRGSAPVRAPDARRSYADQRTAPGGPISRVARRVAPECRVRAANAAATPGPDHGRGAVAGPRDRIECRYLLGNGLGPAPAPAVSRRTRTDPRFYRRHGAPHQPERSDVR